MLVLVASDEVTPVGYNPFLYPVPLPLTPLKGVMVNRGLGCVFGPCLTGVSGQRRLPMGILGFGVPWPRSTSSSTLLPTPPAGGERHGLSPNTFQGPSCVPHAESTFYTV